MQYVVYMEYHINMWVYSYSSSEHQKQLYTNIM